MIYRQRRAWGVRTGRAGSGEARDKEPWAQEDASVSFEPSKDPPEEDEEVSRAACIRWRLVQARKDGQQSPLRSRRAGRMACTLRRRRLRIVASGPFGFATTHLADRHPYHTLPPAGIQEDTCGAKRGLMDSVARDTMDNVAACCCELLRDQGFHAVLRYLNARTRHRYTGVYLLDPPLLRNLALFDREYPSVRQGDDIPLEESYCALVVAQAAPYATADAEHEPRLADHPARTSVLAYCGVPLCTEASGCFGTLCHFDLRPRLVPVEELWLLERLAPVLAAEALRAGALQVPPA